jgi:glycosyltransferase involved in cell wall biosynthesis
LDIEPQRCADDECFMADVRCLVFEPDASGHRLQHVRHLTEALLAAGYRVLLVLQTNAHDRAEYKVHLRSLEPHVELKLRCDPRQQMNFQTPRRRVRELQEAIAALRPDWAYVPYADRITQAAAIDSLMYGGGLIARTPVEAQLMRGKYGYPLRSSRERLSAAANRWLTLRNPWRVTHVLDPWILDGLGKAVASERFRLIPEPVEQREPMDRRDARRLLAIPLEGRYVAMIGALESRKGIEELLAAVERARLAADDRILLVGKMTSPIHELLRTRYDQLLQQQRVLVIDRYVSDDELGAAFFAADVIAVTHPRQIGSSGTLVRAAAAERYLLTSDFGWVGWVNELFQLGTCVNITDSAALATALGTALDRSTHYRRTQAAERFCQYHTVQNQQAHWLREIGAQLGLPLGASGHRLDWDWALKGLPDTRCMTAGRPQQ